MKKFKKFKNQKKWRKFMKKFMIQFEKLKKFLPLKLRKQKLCKSMKLSNRYKMSKNHTCQ